MQHIATAGQWREFDRADTRMIHAVTSLPDGKPEREHSATVQRGTTIFRNEEVGAELKAAYPWIELVTE